MIPLGQVQAAAGRAAAHVRHTPLLDIGGGRHLKLELLQPTGSFKVRGFFAAALLLPDEQRRRGLLTVSAGNAALACAHVAHRLGVSCRVVMYDTAPAPKIAGVRRWGGEPVLMPRERLLAWLAERAWEGEPETFIHPFAAPEVQAGHGGAGLEILADLPGVERVVVAVGGGGLITGVASAVRGLRPEVEVVGVQSSGYPLWIRTLAAGIPANLVPDTIADGTTAPYDAGLEAPLGELVDTWVEVPEAALRAAVPALAATAHVVAEGAGVLAYAALGMLPVGPLTVAVISGGNIAPALLAQLLIDG